MRLLTQLLPVWHNVMLLVSLRTGWKQPPLMLLLQVTLQVCGLHPGQQGLLVPVKLPTGSQLLPLTRQCC
jgi:hypothetical protein